MAFENLRKRKKELKLTNKDLAEKSGIPISTVSKILGGTTAKPRRDTLRALEKVLFEDPEERLPDSMMIQNSSCRRADDSSHLLQAVEAAQYGRPTEMPAVLASPQYVYGSNAEMNGGNTAAVADSAPDRPADTPGTPRRIYTLEDYLKLPDERRVELIDGRFYDMAAPTGMHQTIVMHIWSALFTCITAHNANCVAQASPFDVQLDSDIYTVVEPDVMVFCSHPEAALSVRAVGAPEFVCEVLSPSTAFRDKHLKLFKYLHAGVKEVWLVDREHDRIEVYCRVNNSQNSSTDDNEKTTQERSTAAEDKYPPESRADAEKRVPEEPLPALKDMPDRDCLPTVYTFRDTVPVAISEGKCSVDFAAIDDYLKRFGA